MAYQTKQQQAVLRCLQLRAEECLSAADLSEELRHGGLTVGLATVYRQLDKLTQQGLVHKVTTEEGALYWLDGIGNRVAAIAFGPRKVLLVAGRNKIVATRAAAEARIRDIAAPRNVARLGQKTPCAATGVCADCDSEGRICNTHLRMERCFPRKRITVILIDEEMGL